MGRAGEQHSRQEEQPVQRRRGQRERTTVQKLQRSAVKRARGRVAQAWGPIWSSKQPRGAALSVPPILKLEALACQRQ